MFSFFKFVRCVELHFVYVGTTFVSKVFKIVGSSDVAYFSLLISNITKFCHKPQKQLALVPKRRAK